MKLNRSILFIVFCVHAVGCFLSAQSIDGIVSDQIASHFEQVFSPYSKTGAEYRDNWLPGDDARPSLLNLESEISVDLSCLGETSIPSSDQNAQISFSKVVYSLTYPFRPGKKISLIVGGSEFYLDEDNHQDSHYFDFDKVSQIDAGLMYTANLSPKWDLFMGLGVVHTDGTGETHRVSDDLLAFLGGSVALTPSFTISTGLRLSSNAAYHSSTFPIVMIEWRISDRHRISIRDGIAYQYAITDDWRNMLTLSLQNFNIFVEEKGQWVAGRFEANTSRKIEDNSVRLGYSHWFKNGLILSGSVGFLHLSRIALIRDDDNEELLLKELDSTVGMHLGLSMRF